MSWSDIGDALKKLAGPTAGVLVSALGQPEIAPIVGGLVSSALGVQNEPEAVAGALQADPDAAIKIQRLLAAHREKIEELHLEAKSKQLAEINRTIRAEYAANDPYVRRWRPTYGYTTCVTWFLETCAIVAAIIAAAFVYPEHADKILAGVTALMGALTAMWGIALSVLGVNISSRSKDKQISAGKDPGPGVFQALAQRLKGTGA